MIPKVIHYCWFGNSPLSELARECITSWKKYCPEYEIKEWNESNFDVNCCDFVKELLEMYIGKNFKLKDGSFDMIPCPQKNTEPLKKYGYVFSGIEIWKNEYVTVYPTDFFAHLIMKVKYISKQRTLILMLVRRNLRVFLNVSVQRKNMQRYCGGCLRNER